MISKVTSHMYHLISKFACALVFFTLSYMHHSPSNTAVPEVVVGGEAEVGEGVWVAGIETCYISNKALCN